MAISGAVELLADEEAPEKRQIFIDIASMEYREDENACE